MAAPTKAMVLGLGGGAAALAVILGIVAVAFARRSAINARRADQLAEDLARGRAVAGSGLEASFHWPGNGDLGVASIGLDRLLGIAAGEAVDLAAILARLSSEDAARLGAAVERLRGEGQRFELRVTAADGSPRLDVTGTRAAAANGGSGIDVAWFRDVTGIVTAEEALAQERDGMRRLLDSVPVPIWRRTADLAIRDGNTAYADAADAEDLADALGRNAEIVTERGREIASHARESGERRAERHHVVIEGARRLLEVTEAPLADDSGGIIGFALDYTDVEEAERELARHMASHREVLEQLSTAIAMYGPDTRLRFHNTAFTRLWDLDEAWLSTEPTNSEVLDALRDRRQIPEHADFLAFKKQRLDLFTSLIEPLEELLHLPDGRTLRMVITPHPMGGLLLTFEDVTDRLTLERSYNTLIDVQRDTLDNLYEGVAVFGGDGRLKLSNPAYARVWGLSTEFLGTEPHVTDVVERLRPYFGADSGWGALKSRIVDRAMDRMPMNARLDRVDGSVLSYAKVPLSDGGVLWSYLDITDSIRVERALRERNEALETADQLKSEFIANVSYELRTPLNAIIGFAEILNNQYFGELNDRQKEYSRGVIEASNRLLSLINDILDLAMIEAGRMTLDRNMVDIHALAVGVFNLTRDWARKQDLEIEFDCATNIGTMIADERRLKQALFNLMSNSIKFTPSGGSVTLAAVREGPDVIFTVTDTGVGIAREDSARVFEKFERGADREGRPSGVGLFVELHGGRVEMESTPERGTRVRCVLPTHTEPPAQIAEAS